MQSNSHDPIDQIRRDLEEAQEEYERTQEKLSQIERRVERLKNALDVLRDYVGDGRLADDSLSIGDAAEIVLRDVGAPMSVGEIAEVMQEKGFPYDNSTKQLQRSLAGVLSRDETFQRVRRGIYILDELYEDWQEESSEEGSEASDLTDSEKASTTE